jgi:hypothetical protein
MLVVVGALVSGCADEGLAVLDQPIPPMRLQTRPLQVVVHDVLESAPRGGVVRVCRALADDPVTLKTEETLPLGEVLSAVAREAGTDLTGARSTDWESELLPTLRCPGEAGDYLVIGRSPR